MSLDDTSAREHQPTVGYREKRSIKPRPGEKNRCAQVGIEAEGHDDHHITLVSLQLNFSTHGLHG